MALSAGEAQFECTNEQSLFNAGGGTIKVNVSTGCKSKDFVFILWQGESKLAKILDIIHDSVHVRWYLQKSELPQNFDPIDENGESINLHENEVVENGLVQPGLVDKKLILCKCQVFYANVSDSVEAILEPHRQRKNYTKQMYVCRFKLVKKTIYKLQPVSWRREEPTSGDESTVYDTGDEDAAALSDVFKEIELSVRKRKTTKRSEDTDENRIKLVSPIKIVNGDSVQKVKRPITYRFEDVNAEVSPTKRGKFINERNANYLTQSPKRSDKIRKNLNSSFADVSRDADNNDSFDEMDTYSVVQMPQSAQMRMKLRKTPLTEVNDNITDSPTRNLRNKLFNKNVHPVDAEATPRRSILKTSGESAKTAGTPKRTVFIQEVVNERPKRATATPSTTITATPSKTGTRRSSRPSSATASAKIQLEAEDHTPEILKAPAKTPRTPKTPKSKSARDEASTSQIQTPKSMGRRSSAVPKTPTNEMTPHRKRQLFRSGNLTPSIQSRETTASTEQSELEMIRDRLHVSAVPDSLPCRESEFKSIHSFVKDKINDECGGCIYIAGVPGTGKTATVTQVVHKLQADAKCNALPKFDYVEINGMRLTEPRQAYVQIYRQLTGKTLAWAQARDLLEKRFTDTKTVSKKQTRSTILLIDELDIICNRKQDVVYNLFDWTSKRGSRLVAITIANTMDLPERVLKLKVASRLGLTRITFQPYTFKQLQEVVMARLAGSRHFVSDAVQLVARKVASVSGDCRRALDICRRAAEIAEETKAKDEIVRFAHVNQALEEMFTSPRIRAIKCCTKFEKLFLQAVASEITRTGIEEVDFIGVFAQLQTLAPVLGIKNPPNQSAAMEISLALGASRLLIVEDSRKDIYQKIILNVSVDDLYYALNGRMAEE